MMKVRHILEFIISAGMKIAIAIWLINFIINKTLWAYDFGYRVFTEEPMAPAPGREVTVAITEGKSKLDIAKTLYDKGLVRDKYLAFVQILASEYGGLLEPGVYVLSTSMTTEEMMAAMAPSAFEDEEEE